jgi:hypothetical protein
LTRRAVVLYSFYMPDNAQTASLLADLRRVCDRLRDQLNPAAYDLGRLLERLRRPDLGELRTGLPFHVEQWDDETIIRTIAACANFLVAMGAYQTAVKQYPKARWLLRDGARVCHEYRPAA